MELSGVLVLAVLGVRHGFDPDHIAIIDGVSMRCTVSRPALAKWSGTLFALGHGSVVTLIAVLISLFSHLIHFSSPTWVILDWVPGLLLIGVGLLNARMLLRKTVYRPKGIRSWLIPDRIKKSCNPLAIVLIGAMFAMVFDTTTQTAAWVFTASRQANVTLFLGLSFSVGMIVTDTLDSWILYRVVKRAMDRDTVVAYRRTLGWIIVTLSLAVGGYKITTQLSPKLAIDETVLTGIGVGFFVFMGVFYTYTLFSKTAR
jgi:high-affinity nickel-transport protein